MSVFPQSRRLERPLALVSERISGSFQHFMNGA
jgi:hypothetical protein